MNNIEIIEKTNAEGITTEFVIIDKGNGEYTSMLKSVYDEMIAQQEHLTENPTAQALPKNKQNFYFLN